MPKPIVLLLTLAALASGCASAGLTPGSRAATRRAAEAIDAHLVLIKAERPSSGEAQTRSLGGFMVTQNTPPPSALVGVMLTAEGHVLVPSVLEASADLRIRAFAGDREYRARIRGKDDALNMTLLQLMGEGPFHAIPETEGVEARAGDWLVARIPTDDDTDYEKLTSLVSVRGELPGHIRRLAVSGLGRDTRGAPVLDLKGRLVGLSTGGEVLVWSDIREDLQALLERSGRKKEGADEDAEAKAWLGVALIPVNKDLAREREWPVASLRAAHVEPGGPAAKAGMKEGDILTGLNGKPLRFSGDKTREFFTQALRSRVGRPFEIEVLRGEEKLSVSGILEKRPEPETLVVEELGVTVQEITGMDVFLRGLQTREGVMVTDIKKGGAAANSGSFGMTLLVSEDVIVSVAGVPTPTLAAFREAATRLRREKPDVAVVRYWRGRLSGFAGLNLKSSQKAEGDRP